MQSAIFNTPVLKVESLKTKFDTIVLSNSFVALIGDYIEARILQQLHYWCYSEYGVIIKGLRWIYKPIREWLREAFIGFTDWQLRIAIASLLEKGLIYREKLYVKHHELKHDNPYWHPKNQTYYYSLNYDKLQGLIEQHENAEIIENLRVESHTKLSVEDSQDTKCCELSQNKTDITNIENNSTDQSHPTLPCVGEEKEKINQEKEEINQEKQEFSPKGYRSAYNPELLKEKEINSVDPKTLEQDTNIGQVEEKINQYKNTINNSTQPETEKLQETDRPSPKLKAQSVTLSKQKREDKAPWKDEAEKSQFYRALVQALPIVANSHSPQGLAKTIMAQVKRGEEHTYWDDFKAGLPIGSSTKPEWEVEPGVPYPMFVEYLTEKIIKGNNTQTQEQARNEVFRILLQPRQASAFWGQFKRSVINVSEQMERDRALGVSNPNTPIWTRERIEPSIEEAAAAGDKILAVNGATKLITGETREKVKGEREKEQEFLLSPEDPWTEDDKPQLTMREMLAARGVKGFCKAMPKVSREEAEAEAKKEAEALKRQQMNRKTHLNQMSVDEINELVKDPILRAQLTPQLINSNYELILDYLGQIIGVKLSDLQIRERQALQLEE
jgi:hypothetical protein